MRGADPRVVRRKNLRTKDGKVAILIGNGCGHEPIAMGFVGAGQRLRKRVVQESWEEKRRASSLGDVQVVPGRVPSFFTSNSLVNMSGLGVSDQPTPDTVHEFRKQNASTPPTLPPNTSLVPEVSHDSGWGGMGLKGNRTASGSNLRRSPSEASGIFIDDEEQSRRRASGVFIDEEEQSQRAAAQQEAGETSQTEQHRANSAPTVILRSDESPTLPNSTGYVKTTSMARFYYRRGSVEQVDGVPQTSSDGCFKEQSSSSDMYAARKSYSHADLNKSSSTHFDVPTNP